MLKKLSNIQKDKLLHFFYGTILSFFLIIYFGIVGMIIALIIPAIKELYYDCLLYTSPSPRDRTRSRMPATA